MSTGTNKERLEQNNIKLEDIKTQIQNLPEAGGTVEGIKQFSTIEEMQSDTTSKEGDLAVVYRSEIQNATVNSKFRVATFPETVVLDTAMTDYVDVSYGAVDTSVTFSCWGNLDSSRFSMDCSIGSGYMTIYYTSSDGITYTRTDTNGNPVDFGTEIYYTSPSSWNDAIGKFIQVSGGTFEGLYEYNDNSWSLAPTQLTAIPEYVYGKEFYGKNGAETGTLQNKENLTRDDVRHRVDIWYNYSSGITCPSNASSMFNNYKNLTTIPLLDTSKVTNMLRMFNRCINLTTIPLLNTSSATDMGAMFSGCTKLIAIPLLDTSSVTSMGSMFKGCTSLTTIPQLNTSSVTTMSYMFDGCTNLTTIPQLNTSSATAMQYMFQDCTNLTTIPQLNTSSVTTMQYMFYECTNLTTIPQLNTSSVTTMQNMFNGCTSLSDESLNNILTMCKNATSYSGTKTLKYLGLTSAQATKCTTLSNYSAFTSAGWSTGY